MGYITNEEDEKIVKKFKNVLLLKEDYKLVTTNFRNDGLRNLFNFILTTGIKNTDVEYIRLTSFNTIARHAPFAAKKISTNSTYIGLGDTLGSTEYGIKFGLKTNILFSKHICNLLSSVKYL